MPIDTAKAFSDGGKFYRENLKLFLLISFTGSIPSFFSNVTPEGIYKGIFLFFAVIVELWAMAAVLAAVEKKGAGGNPGVTESFDAALAKLPRFIFHSVLYALVLAAGFIALIIPGFYLWPKYMFVQFESIYGEKGTNPFAESSRISKGSRMKLLITMLVAVLGISLLTGLPELVMRAVGLFADETKYIADLSGNVLGTAVFPWLIVSVYFIYKQLKNVRVLETVSVEAPVEIAPVLPKAKRAGRKK